ncbi:MAG: transcription termination/antitermination protein NusG [Clostridia bacterium]|nr:transcription termination/antitermination protein NusG [Clostridia bacterium]
MSDLNELNVGPRWYVLHTRTGHENKVKAAIERIIDKNISELVLDVTVPCQMIQTTDAKGNEKLVEEKLFPGYVFVKMVMTAKSWYLVRHLPGATGFTGPDSLPVPLTDEEVARFTLEATVTVEAFQIGDEVEIIDGFLVGHTGKIGEISEDGNEVTVIVSSIGREMPVSLDAKSIKKI